MSEIIKEKLKVGSTVVIYKSNGFRYEGRVLNVDGEFVLILDFKTNAEKFINFKDISNIDVQRRLPE